MHRITNEVLAEKVDSINRRLDEGNRHFKELNGFVAKNSQAIIQISTRQNITSWVLKTICVIFGTAFVGILTYVFKHIIRIL